LLLVHRVEVLELFSQHVGVLIKKFNHSSPRSVGISIKNFDIWLNEKLILFGSERSLDFFNSISLLVFLVLLLSLVELLEVKLVEDVIRVDEPSLRVVSHIVVFAIQFSAAASAAVDHSGGDDSPDPYEL